MINIRKFKFLGFLIIAASLILSLFVPTSGGNVKAATTETITTYTAFGTVISPANVVNIPNASGKIITTYSRGQEVFIVGKSQNFYKIKYKNTYAYILISRIQRVNPYTGIAKMKTDVKSYALPNSSSKALRTIKKSSTVDIIGIVGTWYEVEIGNSIEFIPNTNVTVSGTESVTSYTATGIIKSTANIVHVPNMLGVIQKTYSAGTNVKIVGETKSFYKINYNYTYAYVLKSRVSLGGITGTYNGMQYIAHKDIAAYKKAADASIKAIIEKGSKDWRVQLINTPSVIITHTSIGKNFPTALDLVQAYYDIASATAYLEIKVKDKGRGIYFDKQDKIQSQ